MTGVKLVIRLSAVIRTHVSYCHLIIIQWTTQCTSHTVNLLVGDTLHSAWLKLRCFTLLCTTACVYYLNKRIIVRKQNLVDLTTTSVIEVSNRTFWEVKTPTVIKCLNIISYILILLQNLWVSQYILINLTYYNVPRSIVVVDPPRWV